MKGKPPPIELRPGKGEMLFAKVFRDKPALSSSCWTWINLNCLKCAHVNTSELVTAKLTEEEFNPRHLCCHRGPVHRTTLEEWKLLEADQRTNGQADCSGFAAETSQILPEKTIDSVKNGA